MGWWFYVIVKVSKGCYGCPGWFLCLFRWDCFKQAIRISRSTKAALKFSGVREGHYGWLWVAAVTADLWCELCYNMFGDSPLCSVSLPNRRTWLSDVLLYVSLVWGWCKYIETGTFLCCFCRKWKKSSGKRFIYWFKRWNISKWYSSSKSSLGFRPPHQTIFYLSSEQSSFRFCGQPSCLLFSSTNVYSLISSQPTPGSDPETPRSPNAKVSNLELPSLNNLCVVAKQSHMKIILVWGLWCGAFDNSPNPISTCPVHVHVLLVGTVCTISVVRCQQ